LDVRKDEWASPQTVIQLSAPAEEDLIAFFEESKKSVLSLLMKSERERLVNTFKKFKDPEVINELKNDFHLPSNCPVSFILPKKQLILPGS
jgi:hypothetical protein